MIKQIVDSQRTFMVTFPDKCPYCGKDFIFILNNHDIANNYLHVKCWCEHCNNPLFVIYDWEKSITVNTYPTDAVVDIQQEVKDLSPIACEVFQQTLQAKSLGLNYLIGAGLRKTLEHLIWDYLIKFKHIPEDEIKNKKLFQRLEYLQNDNFYIKVCANIIRVFGNSAVHIFDDNDISIEEAITVLATLIDLIYAELYVNKVNAKL